MAIFGDKYSYKIDVDLTGIKEVSELERELARLRREQQQLALEFQKGAISAQQARQADAVLAAQIRDLEKAYQAVGGAAGRAAFGAGRFAGNLAQLTYVVDDVQYGVRGLMNQIPLVTTAMLGFGPAAAAAGLAGTVLAGVFRKQIDSALAWAGVLDENVVKALDRGKGGTESYSDAIEALKRTLDSATEAQQAFAGAIEATDLTGAQIEAALRQLVAQNPAIAAAGRDLGELQRRVAEVQQAVRKAKDEGDRLGIAGFVAGLFGRGARRQLEQQQAEYQAALEKGINDLAKTLQQGGDGAEKILEQLEAIPNKGPDVVQAIEAIKKSLADVRAQQLADQMAEAAKQAKEVNDFADAILDHEQDLLEAQRRRWQEAEAARQEEVRAILEQAALEAQLEQERLARVRNRQEAEARARLDESTRRVVEAFGPLVQGGIQQGLQTGVALGLSPEQAGMRVFADLARRLRAAGAGDASDAAARQLVDEQLGQIQAFVDANNAQAAWTAQILDGFGLAQRLFLQQRAELLAAQRRLAQIQLQMARQSARGRGNMLGPFRPF